jgi:FkbM family methyltransferase
MAREKSRKTFARENRMHEILTLSALVLAVNVDYRGPGFHGHGVCDVTQISRGCSARKKGAWVAESRSHCISLCEECNSCYFISFDPSDWDCSWFRSCPNVKSGPDLHWKEQGANVVYTGKHDTWQVRHANGSLVNAVRVGHQPRLQNSMRGHNFSRHAGTGPWGEAIHANLRLVACVAMHAHAQFGEDLSLLSSLLRLRPNGGVFVEIGAYRGELLSNTVMLERCFNWKGVLIEANPKNFAVLQQTRGKGPSRLVHSAVCSGDGADGRPLPTVPFTIDGMAVAGQVGAMSKAYIARNRIGDNLSDVVQVPCQSLESILYPPGSSAPAVDVDFLSLDVEGAEDVVMQTADPKHFQLVLVELDGLHPPKDDRVRRMLMAGGLRKSALKAGHLNEVYMRELESGMVEVVDMKPPRGFWRGQCNQEPAFHIYSDRCAVGVGSASRMYPNSRFGLTGPRQCILNCLDACKDQCKFISFNMVEQRCVWHSQCGRPEVVDGMRAGIARNGYFTVAIESMRMHSLFADSVVS